MKKITFILPAWDAVENVPFELHKEIELEDERADEAIRLGVAEEVKQEKVSFKKEDKFKVNLNEKKRG